jgi:hypothetical protein
MGIFDSLESLVASIIAAVVLLVFAILSFFVTVFIVRMGAGFAGFTPSGDFVVLSAAIIAASAIVAGATPMKAVSTVTE